MHFKACTFFCLNFNVGVFIVKKLFAITLIIVLCCLTACRKNEDTSSEYSAPPVSEDISEPKPYDADFSSPYEAYYERYSNLVLKYGKAKRFEMKAYQDDIGNSYLGGVCVVSLMDFNGDGTKDLFLVYSTGELTGKNYDENKIPQADTYKIEIWTYLDGRMTPLLYELQVSFVYSFDTCFVTVYENGTGKPVIQLYSENNAGYSYQNIYCSDGKLIKDELTYDEETFKMNGVKITEEVWGEGIGGYNKILLCAYLSGISCDYLLECYGIDYYSTLKQTQDVVRALRESEPAEFAAAQSQYIPLYLKAIEHSNRISCFPDEGQEVIYKDHAYNFYDMNKDGVPELILYEGSSGAGTHYHFYTVLNGEVVDCGRYGRTNLFADGKGGIIAYHARMSGYWIEKIALEGTAIKITSIADGFINAETEAYPELDTFGYKDYKVLAFCPPKVPSVLYTYFMEPLNP